MYCLSANCHRAKSGNLKKFTLTLLLPPPQSSIRKGIPISLLLAADRTFNLFKVSLLTFAFHSQSSKSYPSTTLEIKDIPINCTLITYLKKLTNWSQLLQTWCPIKCTYKCIMQSMSWVIQHVSSIMWKVACFAHETDY